MKKILCTALIFCMTFLTVSAQTISEWAIDDVAKAAELRIITEDDLSADMTQKITREKFAEITVNAYESMSKKEALLPQNNPFSDTDNEAVLRAYNIGIISGISETEFAPKEYLNREQAAAMLVRLYEKIVTDKISEQFTYENKGDLFSDDADISDWAKPSVYFMADNSILKGIEKNLIAPKNITAEQEASGYANTTIEQAVALVIRLYSSPLLEETLNDVDPYGLSNSDISIDSDAYKVAFIGGSLTEGGGQWISKTVDFLKAKMPDEKIEYINAGKGGTGSVYGVARFMHDVGVFNPNLVFIEFAVNDTGATEEKAKMYMESMVRMCAGLDSKPAVVFLYAPQPVEKDSAKYTSWEKGVKWKEQIAKHYGIKSINIYDYMQEDYKKIKSEKGYETFTDYLKTMYSGTPENFDVHGGYAKYAEAILREFENDYDGCMTVPELKSIYCKENKKLVDAKYTYIDVNSPRMKYSGEWATYTKNNPFTDTTKGISISDKHYLFPYFNNGIKQSLRQASAFGFMTKAEAFCINFPSASNGSSAKVYIDMVEKGTVTCYTQQHGINYMGDFVPLPNDGKEHKVIVVVDEATDSNYVFRFGNVIERFAQ